MHFGLQSLLVLVIASSGCTLMPRHSTPLTQLAEDSVGIFSAKPSAQNSKVVTEAQAIQLASYSSDNLPTQEQLGPVVQEVETAAYVTTSSSSRRQRDQLYAQYEKLAQDWMIQRELDLTTGSQLNVDGVEMKPETKSEVASSRFLLTSSVPELHVPKAAQACWSTESMDANMPQPLFFLTFTTLVVCGIAWPCHRWLRNRKPLPTIVNHERQSTPLASSLAIEESTYCVESFSNTNHFYSGSVCLTLWDTACDQATSDSGSTSDWEVGRVEELQSVKASHSNKTSRSISVVENKKASLLQTSNKSIIRIGYESKLVSLSFRLARYTSRSLRRCSNDVFLPYELEGLLVLRAASNSNDLGNCGLVWGVACCQITPDHQFTARLVPVSGTTFNSPRY